MERSFASISVSPSSHRWRPLDHAAAGLFRPLWKVGNDVALPTQDVTEAYYNHPDSVLQTLPHPNYEMRLVYAFSIFMICWAFASEKCLKASLRALQAIFSIFVRFLINLMIS